MAWIYPVSLTKVYGFNVTLVWNAASTADDGRTNVRTYTLTEAKFANGSSSVSLPLFYSVLGES